LALAISLALQPVSADGVWWHAARGRAVLSGATAPSKTLLAGDEQAEADWLGGVPWCLLFSGLGPSGLMLARLVGVGSILFVSLALPVRGGPSIRASVAGTAALVAASPGLDPTGSWWDVMAGWLWIAWCATTDPSHGGRASDERTTDDGGWGAWRGAGTGRRALGLVVTTVMWANLGPRSLLALAMAGGGRALTIALLVALCLTPRGPLGLVDSASTLAPAAALMLREAGGAAWLSGYAIAGPTPEPTQLLAWLVLAAMPLARPQLAAAGIRWVAAWIGLQLLLVANPSSLPALTPWAWWLAVAVQRPLPAFPESLGSPAAASRTAAWSPITAAAIWLLALAAASGPWPGLPWRLGWGVLSRLEYRQLVEPLAGSGPGGTAFAFDERAAGMLVWANPAGPRPWLVPHRALLIGQFIDEATRTAELRVGWDMRQRNRDGGWGGWWIPLMQRGTRLLIVPGGDEAMIRRLEPGIFKPLVIDAPVVPYAVAGDPQQSGAILGGLADRDLVENGDWTFTVPRSIQTDWSWDLWGFVVGRPDPRPLLAQADLFLALQMPRGALKILLPVSQAGLADCVRQITAATMQLAEQERLVLGRPTLFRASVLRALGADIEPASQLALAIGGVLDGTVTDQMRLGDSLTMMRVATTYLDSGPNAALEMLSEAGIEESWSRAMLSLEVGRPAEARDVLEQMAAGDGRFAAAALDMLDELPVTEPSR
jgi:hypothetical protein